MANPKGLNLSKDELLRIDLNAGFLHEQSNVEVVKAVGKQQHIALTAKEEKVILSDDDATNVAAAIRSGHDVVWFNDKANPQNNPNIVPIPNDQLKQVEGFKNLALESHTHRKTQYAVLNLDDPAHRNLLQKSGILPAGSLLDARLTKMQKAKESVVAKEATYENAEAIQAQRRRCERRKKVRNYHLQ